MTTFNARVELLTKKMKAASADADAKMIGFGNKMIASGTSRLQTMSWSKDIIQIAAEYDLREAILYTLNDQAPTTESIKRIREWLTDIVINLAKYPPQSTSPTANLAEQYKGAAAAKILDELKMFDYVEE